MTNSDSSFSITSFILGIKNIKKYPNYFLIDVCVAQMKWKPYYVLPNSKDEVCKQLYAILTGAKPWPESYGVKPIIMVATPEEVSQLKEADVRSKRGGLLRELDAVISNPLRWAGFSTAKQTEFGNYRQALLDVTKQTGFPDTVVWPVFPTL